MYLYCNTNIIHSVDTIHTELHAQKLNAFSNRRSIESRSPIERRHNRGMYFPRTIDWSFLVVQRNHVISHLLCTWESTEFGMHSYVVRVRIRADPDSLQHTWLLSNRTWNTCNYERKNTQLDLYIRSNWYISVEQLIPVDQEPSKNWTDIGGRIFLHILIEIKIIGLWPNDCMSRPPIDKSKIWKFLSQRVLSFQSIFH